MCGYFTCRRVHTILVKCLPSFAAFLATEYELSEKRDHIFKWTKYKLKGFQQIFPKIVLIIEDGS